jgi:hypothetical protein
MDTYAWSKFVKVRSTKGILFMGKKQKESKKCSSNFGVVVQFHET